MNVTDFTFDKETLLEELNKKPLLTDIDGGFLYDNVPLKARGYVTQSEKGIYAGVVESAKMEASRTLLTFFKIDYVNGFIRLWNKKGEELDLKNTATLNRVFRSADLLNSLGDENLKEIVSRGKYWANTASSLKWSRYGSGAGNDFADGIKLSVEPEREVEYNLYTVIVGENGVNSPSDHQLIREAVNLLRQKGLKVSYKSVLRVLGLTKSDVKELKASGGSDELFYDRNDLHGYMGQQSPDRWTRRSANPWGEDDAFVDASLDYSKGDIQSFPGFHRSPRFALELAKILVRVSEEYNYSLNLRDALHEIISRNVDSLAYLGASIRAINMNGATKNVDLVKLVRYLYIDVTMHQGIRSFRDAVSLYKDYINLVGNIEGFTVYPKYLTVAHDIAAKAFKESDNYDESIYEYTEQFLGMEGIYRVSSPGNSDRNYPLVVLRTGTEISEEATNQSNCLASYIKNVASQTDIILSLKKPVDNPKQPGEMQPFISVEVSRNVDRDGEVSLTLRQAYKTFNQQLDDSMMGVLKSIMEANGIKTDRNVIGFGLLKNVTSAKVVSKTSLAGVHEELGIVKEDKNAVNAYLSRL